MWTDINIELYNRGLRLGSNNWPILINGFDIRRKWTDKYPFTYATIKKPESI